MNDFQKKLTESKNSNSPKGKKETMPVINVTNGETKQYIKDFIDAQKREKIAKSDKEAAGNEIIEVARKIQDKDAFGGKFSKSYRVKSDDDIVTYVTANKFSLNLDDKETFQKMLGKNFDTLLEEKFNIFVKPEVFQNPELQKELMSLLEDKFDEFFEITSSLVAKENFDSNVFKAVKNSAGLQKVRSFAKQSKPSIR